MHIQYIIDRRDSLIYIYNKITYTENGLLQHRSPSNKVYKTQSVERTNGQ